MIWKARRNLKSHNVEPGRLWWQFTLQIMPVLFTGGGILYLTFRASPTFESVSITLILAAIAVLFFGALMTFRDQTGWNLALLLGFAAALGAAIAQLSGDQARNVGLELIGIVAVCLLVGAGIGRWLHGRFDEIGVILWLVSWAYLLGWAALIVLGLDPIFYLTWSAAGLVLFTGLAAAWFSNMEMHLSKSSSVSAAIDIFLIGINLGIAALILLRVQI